MNNYRSANWRAFREEIIRLHEGACSTCGRSSSDGAVLHVHHKRYIPNRKPWEYAYADCAALCSGCHAAEHGIIPPKVGWDCVGCDDLGDLIGACDVCGTSIRHVFMIQHPKWETLEVGEMCCDHMTDTQLASNHMESVRRQVARRTRFVSSRRWCQVGQGVHQIRQERIYLELVPDQGCYRLRVNGRTGKKVFPSLLEGKITAFDLMESGEIPSYVKKHKIGVG